MLKQIPIVLTLCVKATRLGAAVFYGERLHYYKLINLISSHTPEVKYAEARIDELIRTYDPDVIVVEPAVYPQQKTTKLLALHKLIRTIATQKALPLKAYLPDEIAKTVIVSGGSTKYGSARAVARKYPELQRYLKTRSKWQWLYIAPLFNAIALGLCEVIDRSKTATDSSPNP
jgi:Holliday junction resolvasome RuvABC endonuclease subunit